MQSHSVICPSLVLAKKYLRTFDEICVNYLRCANKECAGSYQNAKNCEYPQSVYIHLSKFINQSVPLNVSLTMCHPHLEPVLVGPVILFLSECINNSVYTICILENDVVCTYFIFFTFEFFNSIRF